MTKTITLDDKEYKVSDMSTDQKNLVDNLNLNKNSILLYTHTLEALKLTRRILQDELKEGLKD
jgi:hypothetical protein